MVAKDKLRPLSVERVPVNGRGKGVSALVVVPSNKAAACSNNKNNVKKGVKKND